MSRIYTTTNKIKFTHISDRYKVNRAVKGKISELHAMLITYVVANYKDTKKYRQQVVDALNMITYAVYADEALPFNWSPKSPIDTLPDIDAQLVEETLGEIYLTPEGIDWDVKPSYSSTSDDVSDDIDFKPKHTVVGTVKANLDKKVETPSSTEQPTPKQDLYIQSPTVPQFDYTKPWLSATSGADTLVIYTTLPEIPTKQNEISCTTDISAMRETELVNLYPNRVIHTRAAVMYEPCPGIELHPQLGLILPISGFTQEQLIDNLIKYPHIFKLTRLVDDALVSFYSNIEIDGELHNTLDVWDNLEESKVIPRQSEFVKEYVVRRYLLERDVKHLDHKYPMFGSMDPFLTLFMPQVDYIDLGYTDVIQIAKDCVSARVSYKQSRNPVIRRLSNAELHI